MKRQRRTLESKIAAASIIDKVGPALILMGLFGGMSVLYPGFLSVSNLSTIGVQASTRAILALGITVVIISGGIDLSVGTVMSASMVTMGVFILYFGVNTVTGILVAIITGTCAGLVNGLLISYGRLPPFIATLGMLGIAQGAALVMSKGYSMYGFPESFQFIAAGEIVGIPFPIFAVAGATLLVHSVLYEAKVGRYAFAIGGNEEATRRAGISTNRYKVSFYVISGCFAGIASVVLSSRINSAHPGVGFGYELDAIAAAVIGGNSLRGGKGNVLGSVIGALIMATIRYSLNILGISSFWQQLALGVVLLVVVYFDQMRAMNRAT
jgi:ribose transport system permease protein